MEFYSSLFLSRLTFIFWIFMPTYLVQETNIHKRKILSGAEIYQRLQELQNWQIKDNQLSYTHQFKNFVEAVILDQQCKS